MKLSEVAERFALDEVFSEYPTGTTIEDLENILESKKLFELPDYIVFQNYENYLSDSDILQTLYDKAWAFERYYEMVEA